MFTQVENSGLSFPSPEQYEDPEVSQLKVTCTIGSEANSVDNCTSGGGLY